MKIDAVEFASLLCSRLCHDLLSPVGAITNGLELLADESDPVVRDQCLDLLADSTRATVNKLKFFRLAFGAAGGFADMVDAREVRDALEGMFGATRRITINWMVREAQLSKPAVKTLLNLALIAGDALVRGGQMDVGAEVQPGRTDIAVRASGDRLILDPQIRETVLGRTAPEDMSARLVAAWLAHWLANESGGAIQVSEPESPFLLFGAVLNG